jgi:hypothetical protein
VIHFRQLATNALDAAFGLFLGFHLEGLAVMNIKTNTITAKIPVASMANEGNTFTANIRNISILSAGK